MSAFLSTNPEPPHVPHHTVTRSIGGGSYGEIWLAKSLTGAWRAVKIVARNRFEDSRAFDREFQGMAQFEPISREHLNFVDILHVGRSEEEDFFYYVMELADDVVQRQAFEPDAYQPKTLRSEMQRCTRMPAEEVITLGLALTTALAALHRHGLVHRDIKPANVIFCGGIPKIADIGLVSVMGQDSFVGTEGYVPPEGPGSPQADLFSLGKVLYELAMGKDRMDFPALNTSIDELPDREVLMRLNEVLLRACNFDPTQRYATAEEMHEDLLRVREGRPLIGGMVRRRKWWLAIAAVLMLGGGGWFWMNRAQGSLELQKGAAFVECEPPGVRFLVPALEGRFFETNKRIEDLPVGEYEAFTLDRNFDKQPFRLKISAGGEARPAKLVLKRSTGPLRVESSPPGCTVEVRQGEQLIGSGRTPADWPSVPTGSYEVIARMGSIEKRATAQVERPGSEPVAPLKFEFRSREYSITSVPPGAEILLDGQPSGITPCKLSVLEGKHDITARYRSWPPQTRSILDDSPEGIVFSFQTGSVKITSKPSGAEVYDGETKLGPTPWLIEGLEPGKVTYTVRLPGTERMATATATVEPGKQVLASCVFEFSSGPQRGEPWENSLGMKFVPVGDILVGAWPVRLKDYKTFCSEDGRTPPFVDFPQEESHPAVRINRQDANAFCRWLTERERAANKLADGQIYRLPTDAEWSMAAGITDEQGASPEERDSRSMPDLPWGKAWPPPAGSGNFADAAFKKGSLGNSRVAMITNYTDGFAQTSPVGSFPANKLGLFDMCGNVWQWVSDNYHGNPQKKEWGVLRGGSWGTSRQEELRLGYRDVVDPGERDVIFGFRCVLVPER